MADAIMGLTKANGRVSVLLMYDVPPGSIKTDPTTTENVVLSPSADLPAESSIGPNPVTQAEKDEFDAGTMVYRVHTFGINSDWPDETAGIVAEARKGWAAMQAILLAEYDAKAASWDHAGVRITPA